jgi:UDP-GlcNAc3NAcA epimerase
MKLLTVVGARPQFIKAAMISRAIIAHNQTASAGSFIEEQILHTGQHYDPNMSEIFFTQLGIPEPAVNLNINGGSHGEMTARMLVRIESEILARQPDMVMIYGDTNSTLAGALAASKLHVPVAHVEAGLRSFNRRMPEEINRVLTDHLASLLFCPTLTAMENLVREGITQGVHHVGDVMYDAALVFADIAAKKSTILKELGLTSGQYLLATVHRAENTDDPERLENILRAFDELSRSFPLVFPVHPRTREKMKNSAFRISNSGLQNIRLIDPVSFIDMVQLERNALCILTDSGGIQKEAYFHGVPCVTLRNETEWVETVIAGWNQVVGANAKRISRAVGLAHKGRGITEYGEGACSEKIVELMVRRVADIKKKVD